MARRLRLGAVSYLNVRPLVHGLAARPDVSLEFDVPAVCAERLARGEIDLGMVPSITYPGRPMDRIVPGVCIGSDGPVASVALFSRLPMRGVRSIALDTSSRTSAALVRILCRRVFDITPTFIERPPDIQSMIASADAALLIGDNALFLDAPALGLEKTDLGGAWTGMTGLPFVWAFWSGPGDAVDPAHVEVLQAAARAGSAAIDSIAADYCANQPSRVPLAVEYLRRHLSFDLDARAVQGLTTYYREAAELGLASPGAVIRFFDGPSSA